MDVERLVEASFDPSPESFNRVELGRVRGHEHRLDIHFIHQFESQMGPMRTVVVHDYINYFVSRYSSLFSDETEELPCCYLVSGLVQLIDEVALHAVTKTAEHSNAREACTGNRNRDIVAPGHVSRGGPRPGVH